MPTIRKYVWTCTVQKSYILCNMTRDEEGGGMHGWVYQANLTCVAKLNIKRFILAKKTTITANQEQTLCCFRAHELLFAQLPVILKSMVLIVIIYSKSCLGECTLDLDESDPSTGNTPTRNQPIKSTPVYLLVYTMCGVIKIFDPRHVRGKGIHIYCASVQLFAQLLKCLQNGKSVQKFHFPLLDAKQKEDA